MKSLMFIFSIFGSRRYSQQCSPARPARLFTVARVPLFRLSGRLRIAMAHLLASEASLGRRCKAKAKAKAKEPDLVAVRELLAREAAEEHRAAQCDAEVREAWRNEAATQPDPWGDMAAVEFAVDNLPGSVVHTASSTVDNLTGGGVPCTSCHTVHRGPCSFHDVLRAEIAQLKMYADHFVPRTDDFAALRDTLHQLIACIHDYLAHGGLTPETYSDLLLEARSAKEHCERSVCDR
jgi:hypothetical protein